MGNYEFLEDIRFLLFTQHHHISSEKIFSMSYATLAGVSKLLVFLKVGISCLCITEKASEVPSRGHAQRGPGAALSLTAPLFSFLRHTFISDIFI